MTENDHLRERLHQDVFEPEVLELGVKNSIFREEAIRRNHKFSGMSTKPKILRGVIKHSFSPDFGFMVDVIATRLKVIFGTMPGRDFKHLKENLQIDRKTPMVEAANIIAKQFVRKLAKLFQFILECENFCEVMEYSRLFSEEIPKPLLEIIRLAHWSRCEEMLNTVFNAKLVNELENTELHTNFKSHLEVTGFDPDQGFSIEKVDRTTLRQLSDLLAEFNFICRNALQTEMIPIQWENLSDYLDKPNVYLSCIFDGLEKDGYFEIRHNDAAGKNCILQTLVYGHTIKTEEVSDYYLNIHKEYYDCDMVKLYMAEWISRTWTSGTSRRKPTYTPSGKMDSRPIMSYDNQATVSRYSPDGGYVKGFAEQRPKDEKHAQHIKDETTKFKKILDKAQSDVDRYGKIKHSKVYGTRKNLKNKAAQQIESNTE